MCIRDRTLVGSRDGKAAVNKTQDEYLAASFYSGASGFHKFEHDGAYYFSYNGADGKTLLRSEGYSSSASRDNGIKSVTNNAPNKARWKTSRTLAGKYFYSLKAGNHQEIGQSPHFSSEEEMQGYLAWMQGNVSTSGGSSASSGSSTASTGSTSSSESTASKSTASGKGEQQDGKAAEGQAGKLGIAGKTGLAAGAAATGAGALGGSEEGQKVSVKAAAPSEKMPEEKPIIKDPQVVSAKAAAPSTPIGEEDDYLP